MIHELKIDEQYFDAVCEGIKNFEIRYNDRKFEVGDSILLHEIDSKRRYTGRKVSGTITYITDYQQKEGFVVFSFKKN